MLLLLLLLLSLLAIGCVPAEAVRLRRKKMKAENEVAAGDDITTKKWPRRAGVLLSRSPAKQDE